MSVLLERAAPSTAPRLLRRLVDSARTHQIILVGYCAVLFFHGINAGSFYRTEALRAIVAREFLRSGNWIVPTLYDEPLLTKPPGHYAAIALVSLPGGRVTEWSARLPSALAASITVVTFYCWFGRVLGQRAGLIASFIVPSSAMWFDRVPSAEIDMVQLAWVVGSLYCFWRAEERAVLRTAAKREWGWWVAALLCVAGGVLTKWTAPIFFYGTILPYLWWRGRLCAVLEWPHLLSVAIAAGVVFAWIGAVVACVGWERLYDTICQEALPKFLPGQRDRGYSWLEAGLLPLRLLVGNLPWTLFALVTLAPAVSRRWSAPAKQLLVFFHCWLWPNLLFWTLIPNHAPRHSFPLAPAITALAALVWIAFFNGQLRWPVRFVSAATSLGVVLALLFVAKLAFVAVIVPERSGSRKPLETGRLLAEQVPVGETLYLFAVKDEGVMFYYDRPVHRFRDPTLLPSDGELLYCIITEAEWRQWHDVTSGETLHELQDEQGAKLLLVRMRFEPSRISTTPAERTPTW